MRFVLFLFVFMFCVSVYGQENTMTVDELFRLALNQHKSGKYQEAINNYTLLLDNLDDNESRRQVFIKRGLAKNRVKAYKSAVKDFTFAIQLDSADMASFVDRGLAYYYDKNYDKAKKDFRYVKAQSKNRKMTENSIYWLVRIAMNKFNNQEAIKYCNDLIMANSDDAEFYFLRALAYANLMKNEEALKDYDKAIKIRPNYVEAITNRGVLKINMLTTKGIISPTKKQTKSACKDLKRGFDLGDKANTEDLIFVYCRKN